MEEEFSCPYNEGVTCLHSKKRCHCCGWHPYVAMARLERICKKLGIPVPVPRKPVQKEEE